jgi:hypothetical protein
VVLPSLLGACGAGNNYVGEDWSDAGADVQTSKPSDACSDCTSDPGPATLSIFAPDTCLTAKQPGKTFIVANNGQTPSSPLTVSLSGDGATSFAITSNTCQGPSLAPHSECAVLVVYDPASPPAVSENATLTIGDKDGSVNATLRGSGVAIVTASPAALSFSAEAGSTSAEIFVQVTATSYCSSIVESLVVDNANFILSSNSCIGRVADSCQFGVRLAPAADLAPSTISGTVTVTLRDTGKATVALSGIVTAPAKGTGTLTASPTTLDFGDVIVGESGLGIIAVSGAKASPAFSLSGDGAASFSLVANTCTAPGIACTIQAKFTPTVAGPRSASLTIKDGETTAVVALTGKGLAISVGASFSASPALLDFGQVSVGLTSEPLTVTVTTSSVRAFKPSLSDSVAKEVTIVAETCSSKIPAGGTCTISIAYHPTRIGKLNGTLNIYDGIEAIAVVLAGEGWTLL